ncbi:MAG TPA: hypothetical protein VLM89_17685, partial [Phycisphaerae bacterium]|nr:hypothetical protein [Phycisphaerae bacterium]
GGPLGLQLVLILVAVVLMPWCAGGDSAWSVFKRSLKNVYWSTTIWPLMALAFGWLGSLNDREWYRRLTELQGACLILVVVGVVWILLLRALLVGAGRYVGPADGPAFRPREPLCDRCGYRITGLPLSGNCPECGLPVRESLPGGRRKPNDWQKHQFRPRGLIEAARLQWRVLRGPGFFERLPVHESPATARHFWWATFMLILLGTLIAGWAVTGALAVGGREYTREVLGARILIGLCMMLIPFSLQTLITFAACLWSQFRLGMRDYRVSATVCCYASPLMWPVIATLFVGCIGLPALGNSGFMGDRRIAFLGLQMVYGDLVALGYCCLVIGSLGYWATRLGRALRSVRHANV